MTRVHRLLAALVALLCLALTGCGPDYADLPLPGKNVSGDTYRVTATFTEALNLAQGAQIKLNGVTVGRVQEVTAKDFAAQVAMDVKAETELREGTTARLRYDTPLGELFVELSPSERGRVLQDGDRLGDDATSTAPTVEDTLASASLLVNGGGLAQLQTITEELNTALGGREPAVRRVLSKTGRFLAMANESTGDIDRVLRALDRTARVLDAREGTINRALREVRPIARVLRDNTDELVAFLVAVDAMSTTAQRVVGATRRDLVQILRQVGPIMDQILELEPQFVPGLQALIRASQFLAETVEGDWIPFDAQFDVEETQVDLPGGGGGDGGDGDGDGGSGLPLDPGDLPGTGDLPGGDDLPGGGGGGLPGLGLSALVGGGGR